MALATYAVMATWREGRRLLNWAVARQQMFASMARNSQLAYRYFGVPTHRLLEVGAQTEL